MDVESLKRIMDYWSFPGRDYDMRVAALMSGSGLPDGVPLLDATTVNGNGGGNTMSGSGALALLYTDGLDSIAGFDPPSQQVTISP